MKKSLKAVLFSAFVCPGGGHLYLKKYIRAALLILVSVACVGVLLSVAMEKAQQIADKILAGEIPLDLTRITAEVSNQVAAGGTQMANIATYLLLTCWLVGIADCYRLGRIQDKMDHSGNHLR